MRILLACSSKKKKHAIQLPARELYLGALFTRGISYAEMHGYQVDILSAKYGWISPKQVIRTYDKKMIVEYRGDFPEGEGFYVGGSLYFGNAPDRYQPLIPNGRYGTMCNYLAQLIDGVRSREEIFELSKIKRPTGIIKRIYYLLRSGRYTKEELYEHLAEEFGAVESMKKTITAQLRSNRMGSEKNCTIHTDGDKYWLTSSSDFYAARGEHQ